MKGIGPNAIGSPAKIMGRREKRLRRRAGKLAARAVKAKTDEKFEKLQNRRANLFRKARRIAREHGLKVAWRPLRNEFVSRNAVVGNGTRVDPD